MACYNLQCNCNHSNTICSNPHACRSFECQNRHSKQRTRACDKVNTAQGCRFGQRCIFLHPQGATQPANVPSASRILRLTNFDTIVDTKATEATLQTYLVQLGQQSVMAVVTTPASQPAFALVYCQDPAAAKTALQQIQASPRAAGLGQLQAQLHNPVAALQSVAEGHGTTNGQASRADPRPYASRQANTQGPRPYANGQANSQGPRPYANGQANNAESRPHRGGAFVQPIQFQFRPPFPGAPAHQVCLMTNQRLQVHTTCYVAAICAACGVIKTIASLPSPILYDSATNHQEAASTVTQH